MSLLLGHGLGSFSVYGKTSQNVGWREGIWGHKKGIKTHEPCRKENLQRVNQQYVSRVVLHTQGLGHR